MQLSYETDSYNDRRYGKPWIAKVDFSSNKQGDFHFGDWIGTPGGAGVLELEVDVGDIVAIGQKDHRNSRNSAPTFHAVRKDGKLLHLGDKGAAYKYFKENRGNAGTEISETA